MNSNSASLPSPLASGPSTPPSGDEVLVRVEGVSKKFCRSLKKSLWYGVCDIASELNPFGRAPAYTNSNKSLTTIERHGGREKEQSQIGPKGEGVGTTESKDNKNVPSAFGEQKVGTSGPVVHEFEKSGVYGETPLPDDNNLREGEFYAVKDVSFELRRGECLGLIGHNGAGKTTLLKMLNGLIKPDAGSITMRGRVGALIALGAGFNPILTGRENIYINGSVLGLTKKEIDAKIDEIIDFAEIREFIDMPVQSYSSGMTVRLGFAVATALDPDVLILDEVLAVGDVSFQAKCMKRISELLGRAAVIFVSHQHYLVTRICDRALWLANGVTRGSGRTNSILAEYQDEQIEKAAKKSANFVGEDAIRAVTCFIPNPKIQSGDNLEIILTIESSGKVDFESIFILIYDDSEECVARSTIYHPSYLSGERSTIPISVENLRMRPGRYNIEIIAHREGEKIRVFNLTSAGYFTSHSPVHSLVTYQPLGKIAAI